MVILFTQLEKQSKNMKLFSDSETLNSVADYGDSEQQD